MKSNKKKENNYFYLKKSVKKNLMQYFKKLRPKLQPVQSSLEKANGRLIMTVSLIIIRDKILKQKIKFQLMLPTMPKKRVLNKKKTNLVKNRTMNQLMTQILLTLKRSQRNTKIKRRRTRKTRRIKRKRKREESTMKK